MVPEAKQGCGKGAAVIQAVGYNTSNYYIILELAYLVLTVALWAPRGSRKLK